MSCLCGTADSRCVTTPEGREKSSASRASQPRGGELFMPKCLRRLPYKLMQSHVHSALLPNVEESHWGWRLGGGVKRSDWSDTEACCFIHVTCACTPYSTWNKDKDVCIFCRHLRTTLVCTKTMKKSESREWIRAAPLFEFAKQTRRPASAWT